jgi:hypothetical protein
MDRKDIRIARLWPGIAPNGNGRVIVARVIVVSSLQRANFLTRISRACVNVWRMARTERSTRRSLPLAPSVAKSSSYVRFAWIKARPARADAVRPRQIG